MMPVSILFFAEGSVLAALDDGKKETLARLCGLNSADSHKKVIICHRV